MNNTYVSRSLISGRGVIAGKSFQAGELIETAYAIVIPAREGKRWLDDDVMNHYTYDWGYGRSAIATGTAELYNHSDTPNVDFEIDTDEGEIVFRALRDIDANEELFIRYSEEPMMLGKRAAKRARGK